MTPPPVPLPPPEGPFDDEALERALFEQALLPPPPDLAARVVAALPGPGRVLSLPALARLAAAVLLAIGTWVATLGGFPTLAHAEPPALVGEVLAPTREILPEAGLDELDLGALGLEEAAPEDDVPAAGLAAAGVVLLGAGLLLARRPSPEKPS